MRVIALILPALVVLAGCAEPTPPPVVAAPSPDTVDIVESPRLIANNASDIHGVIRRVPGPNTRIERRILINDVDLLLTSALGRAYAAAANHKALAVGTPRDTCPHYEAAVGAPSAQIAVGDALAQCLAFFQTYTSAGRACGCEVIAVDRAVLAEPADLPYRARLQAHLVWRSKGAGIRRQVLVADIADHTGPTDIVLSDVRGQTQCTGTLTPEAPGRGRMALDCPTLKLALSGPYAIEGLRQGRDYGVASIAGKGTSAALLLGYSEAQYQEARAPVLEQLARP